MGALPDWVQFEQYLKIDCGITALRNGHMPYYYRTYYLRILEFFKDKELTIKRVTIDLLKELVDTSQYDIELLIKNKKENERRIVLS